jgi:hypothetical protein
VTETGIGARGRWSLALTLAVVALLLPVAAPVARAAEDLRIAADTTYRVDTDAGVVRVRIDIRVTNLKPNLVRRTATQTVTTRYYFDRLFFSIQSEARSVHATSGGSSLRVAIETKATYQALTVRMPGLYFRQSRNLRIEYVLPGGKPRSKSDVRVGAAFATFTAWAWGDAGRSTVRVVMPKGFTDRGYGETLKAGEEDGRVVLSSGTIADPGAWYAVISADRPSALTHLEVGPPSSRMIVQAWPEDTAWRDQVRRVLEHGVPVLQELIGLDWPVEGELTVTEVHTPLLEGYAGFYQPLTDSIRISEELDGHTILHEASHAWFDTAFIDERWVLEGLAEEYATEARAGLGIDGPDAPEAVTPDDEAAFPLVDWPPPARIDDKAAAAKEDYGYAASWTVIREIATEAGPDRMREVLRALAGRTIPYVGDGPAETAGRRPDWRSFLDLVEEVGGADGAEELFRTWVAPPSAIADLDVRADARAAYHRLEAAADEWAPPYLVRERLWAWSFQEATDAMTAADEVIADRETLDEVSARLGATPPDDLEVPFEAATTIAELDTIEADLEHRTDVADSLVATRDQLALPRGPIAELGLAGEAPAAGMDAALAAYAAGDFDRALAGSASTAALLAGAEEVGRGRGLAIAAGVVALVLLALLAVWFVRRRGRASARFAVAAAIDLGAGPDAPTTLAPTTDAGDGSAEPEPVASPPAASEIEPSSQPNVPSSVPPTIPPTTPPEPGVDPD